MSPRGARAHTLSLSLTHTLSHTLSLTHTLSLSLSLSLTRSRTHTLVRTTPKLVDTGLVTFVRAVNMRELVVASTQFGDRITVGLRGNAVPFVCTFRSFGADPNPCGTVGISENISSYMV